MLQDHSTIMLTVLLFLYLCKCSGAETEWGSSVSITSNFTIRLQSDSNSSAWGSASSGRVEVYLEEEWRGVVLGSIRTTSEGNKICEHLNFPKGVAEISVHKEGEICNNSVLCSWEFKKDGAISYNCCSNATEESFISFQQITALKCNTLSNFGPEAVALVVAVSLLLAIIAVGALVIAHFLRKVKRLNVIIHQLIYKQQRIKSSMDHKTPEGVMCTDRSSMYAKPFNGSARQESRSANEENESSASKTLAGPGQYSLLGHEKKYENIDMDEIKEVP